MAILRAFLIFSLFTQLALANQTCQSSSAQSFSFSRIEIELYKEQIADASKKLNLTEEIFLTRLEKNKLSLAKFFEYVDSYKKSPNESFQSFVLNPYKVLESIRLRGVNLSLIHI